MRTLLVLSLLASACGSHSMTFEGVAKDARGNVLPNAQVTLRDVGFSEDPLTESSYLDRSDTFASATSDGSGRFTVTQTIGNGGFGCGAASQTALVVTSDASAMAMKVVADTGSDQALDVGEVRLPVSATTATFDGTLHVAFDPGIAGTTIVHVDDADWLVGSDGALPADALVACADGEACAHEVTSIWSNDGLLTRAATTTLMAPGATPMRDEATTSIAFASAVELAAIDVDRVYSVDQVRSGSLPSIDGLVSTSAGPASCTIYGTGVRCVASAAVTSLSIATTSEPYEVRVFTP